MAFQITMETIHTIARNFPALATKKVGELTITDINVLLMINQSNQLEHIF